MVISEQHRTTIRNLVAADPEVAQAACDIPHLDPSSYLIETPDGELPFCGCFVGVYAWMMSCKHGYQIDPNEDDIPNAAVAETALCVVDVQEFAGWCTTKERDEEAVRYARRLLS